MAKKKKFYVVWNGKPSGIFDSWDACQKASQGVSGAKFKAFPSRQAAELAYKEGAEAHWGQGKGTISAANIPFNTPNWPIAPALCVDAACNGKTGLTEYRGVMVPSGKEVFRQGPFKKGSNNIGEFLALVHGLAYLQNNQQSLPIYSDSKTAMSWLYKQAVNSKVRTEDGLSPELESLVVRALDWLANNTIATDILKWDTKVWGEIPADFGRK